MFSGTLCGKVLNLYGCMASLRFFSSREYLLVRYAMKLSLCYAGLTGHDLVMMNKEIQEIILPKIKFNVICKF